MSTNGHHTNGAAANGRSNGTNGHGSSALCSVEEFVGQDYDYVVVGGGTAGLCIAARLSEDPNVTVGVLEAGQNRMEDKSVLTPSLYPTLIGRKEYDWLMTSVPQPEANNKSYSMPRGKLLGGSSGINYLMYVRGSKKDYETWAELAGSKEWGWDGLLPYFKKHQTIDLPGEKIKISDPKLMPHVDYEKSHGTEGPIHTSFNDHRMPLEDDFIKAAYEHGGRENTLKDAWSGDHMGFYSSLAAVDRVGNRGTRSYSATGYLKPNLGRPNLKVLTEALASKVVLQDKTATGVEFLHGGRTHKVSVKKEVILSAGVVQSPQLLELSGIGDPEILRKAGVQCIVESPSVGANFQDHVLTGIGYDLKEGIHSMDQLHDEEFAATQQKLYDDSQEGMYGSPGMCMGFVSYASLVSPEELEETIALIRKVSTAKTKFEKLQEQLIVDQLRDPTFANLQTFCIPCSLDVNAGSDQVKFFNPPPKGVERISLLMCLEHPLSRGSIHITSSDPTKTPRIDPGYFRNPADTKILAAGIKWIDEIAKSKHLEPSLGKRWQPPAEQSLETEEERIEMLRDHISTQYHLCGSVALGEVVDARLRVKGVKGLRVCDASIFPAHVSGNIMASTYAVAEKGAALIKADA